MRKNKMTIDTRNPLTKYENSTIEYKSLKKAIGKSADLKDLAKTCVCLANAQGGYLFIGIEDKVDFIKSVKKEF